MTEDGWWKREVLKRVRSLVVPFYCWSFIAFVVATAEKIAAAKFLGASLPAAIGNVWSEGIPWVSILGLDLTALPFIGALWYVRNLMFFVLLRPLFLKVIRRGGWMLLLTLYVVYLALAAFVLPHLSARVNGFLNSGFSLYGMLWFLLGILLRMYPVPRLPFLMVPVGWVAGAVLWLVARQDVPIQISNVISSLGGVSWAYALWKSMSSSSWPAWLVGSAFPMFLAHNIFIGILQMVPSHIPGTECLIGFVIHWLVPIGASILMALLLRRIVPGLTKLMFGGRC